MESDEIPPPAPSQEAIDSATKLQAELSEAFPEAVRNFEARWAAAHAVRHSHSSNPGPGADDDACIRTDEFDKVKRLGPKIIPFVVYKLAIDDDANENLWAVFLYNALEKDPDYLHQPADLTTADLRHSRTRIIESNHQRHQFVAQRIAAWEQLHKSSLSSNMGEYTETDEYWDLLEMGPSITAPVMLAFRRMGWGYWFELLHEMAHGHKTGIVQFQWHVLYDGCLRFFNEGEGVGVPKYQWTPFDIWVREGRIVR
ncbi:hypothetical protein F4778DRAFT_737863 [Xylariomycetidae sp. FL2044]|nr:hypothetical protein F4778DRAFT_737863 [Xylariomycetidae sp. FL2044]